MTTPSGGKIPEIFSPLVGAEAVLAEGADTRLPLMPG